MSRLALAGLAALLVTAGALAHDGVEHRSAAEALEHLSQGVDDGIAEPFPAKLGGAYSLTDQHGRPRSQRDPEGRAQLVFFGYATCRAICSVALPRMAEIADAAAAAGLAVRPVLITVDPARDTPEAMAPVLAELHPDAIGLTGSEAELEAVRRLFQVERKLVFEDPFEGPVYAHGSFIYLMSAEGEFLTLMPPIVAPDHGAEVVAKYLAAGD